MELDAASLEAIAQAARSCFLHEDAPDYLSILEISLRNLRSGNLSDEDRSAAYANLIRAAHSLKGGAGIANLPGVMHLAHQLEDLLLALQEGRVAQWEFAYELVELSVQEINDQITTAINGQSETTPSAIREALEHFLADLPPPATTNSNGDQSLPSNSYLVKTALNVDLEDCLQRVEQLLTSKGGESAPNPSTLRQALSTLGEECLLLGQALSLTWLIEIAELTKQELSQPRPPLKQIATAVLAELRQLRTQFLHQESAPLRQLAQTKPPTTLEKEKGQPPTSPQDSPPTPKPSPQPSVEAVPVASLELRVPVNRLDRMSDAVTDLLIGYERLSVYQQQLLSSSQGLGKRAQQIDAYGTQVQSFYDQMSLSPSLEVTEPTAASEFDPLQFDRYTELHRTLPDFQELAVQVQETKADLDEIARELQASLDRVRNSLSNLRRDLTESRLVPFSFLAERFLQPLQELNHRYHKNAQLRIEGKTTLIDQVILEQLQTPLTQLVRNAFDHGIEPSAERVALGKSEIAYITLSASVQGNQVVVTVADDGRGIDTQKVYHRAVQLGLYNPKTGNPLSHQQILTFLFQPSFSTAESVSSLSGRGMGLDIVRLSVRRLRGLIQVASALGKGTKFTISVPLTLNILPLLFCRCQQRTLAIPSTSIREIVRLSEFDASTQQGVFTWQEQVLPVFSLVQLLPYRHVSSLDSQPSDIGIVLDIKRQLIVVIVDDLLMERELVIKPFEPTIPVPSYLAGCTVLGTGEVVPVLSPMHMGELVTQFKSPVPVLKTQLPATQADSKTILIADDSIAVRRSLSRILSHVGYQVVQCRNGKEAIAELNRPGGRFDLVISDIEMPGLDGFALLKEIRSHSTWHYLPVALLTSRASEQHRSKAQSLGATAYFTKPFQPRELLNAIAVLV